MQAAALALTSAAAVAQEGDTAATMEAVLQSQLKAVSDVLSPELRAGLAATQARWVAYRDEQCAFERKFAAEHGRGNAQGSPDGRDPRCLARFNQQRLGELQRYLSSLMESTSRPQKAHGDFAPKQCRLSGLPANFEVHAVGTYSGLKPIDTQLPGGHETRETAVIVNKPGVPVVLVLMAYDPVVWKVSRTPETQIAAVIVGSYHRQAVLGIDKATPLLFRSHEERADCGAFHAYRAGRELEQAAQRVKAITGRDIDSFVNNPVDGGFIVGAEAGIDINKLIFSPDLELEDYAGAKFAPAGQQGLDLLVEQGKIRPATQADIDAWVAKASEPYKRLNPDLKVPVRMRVGRTYVVLQPIELPNGLHGGHARSFIIPAGVPQPSGSAGHSMFYFMESGNCTLGLSMPCPE
jgi:uncharacterized protein YecT (DUF1311 family)